MIRVLQINVGVCRASQDLALATANEKEADVLIICEQHRDRGEDNRWFPDANGRAAIAVLSNISVDAIGQPSPGFRWLEIKGYRLYSCYISPNVTFLEFEAFLVGLEASVRTATGPVVVAGDFNSKSPEWGSPREDRRGRALADLIAALGLAVRNEGGQPTFVRGASESHLDLTLATQAAIANVTDWAVMEEETLSLHMYIGFKITTTRGQQREQAKKGWAYSKFDHQKLKDKMHSGAPSPPVDAPSMCRQAIKWLTEACDACMPRVSGTSKRRPAFWWNDDIADQRKACLKARRSYTRKRKKAGEAGSTREKENYKQQRKALSVKITAAKDRNWSELCGQVESDPWGTPYKIVMKRLARRKPIPGLEIPGRLDSIVDTLFPRRAVTGRTIVDVSEEELQRALFTETEVKAAARGLPNGKAPGPDGVPNEVLKTAVGAHPGYFQEVFNGCLRSAFFPPEWKTARLVLLHKPGRPLDNPSAYRPLCMLDTMGKLFEKLLTQRLRDHLRRTGNQPENQYGFKKGKSTLDAMAKIQTAVRNANGRTSAYNRYVGMLTLDVQNAFNSASWTAIIKALERTDAPKYLQNVLGQYLSDRHIIVERPDCAPRVIEMSCGVPQGSVLGPDLWNLMYDGLLSIKLPSNTELIAFADDVAIVCTAQVPFILEEKLGKALQDVVTWMTDNGLELALQKTEAIVFTNRNVHNTMTVEFPPHSFASSRSVKYLGVQFDPRQRFLEHAKLAAKRAMEAGRHLAQILPNLRGAKQKTRRVLSTVVTSRLLYGAPIWAEKMSAEAMATMESAYRRTMLRVACCYSTTSYDAAAVVSSMPPLKLLAEERRSIFLGTSKEVARGHLLTEWQQKWSTSGKGRWTNRIIGDVSIWYRRKHGEVSYHLAQVLTGHGCFGTYLHKYCNLATDACAQCGTTPDTPEHAVFQCDAWHKWRTEACVYIGVDILTPENTAAIMLSSKKSWERVNSLFTRIMMCREREERRVQRGGA